jgi:hypothetical protein
MYDLCVWHRLAARFMRLGGKKGVDRLASPYRLKNLDCSGSYYSTPRVRDSIGLQYIYNHPLVARIIVCLVGICPLLSLPRW